MHGNISTLEYYKKAITIIEGKISNPQFFVFSDDINWCIKNLILKGAFYVDGKIGKESYKDMQLMSFCKHNIIANSSFSWWAAWLNKNKSKIVIAPSRMINSDYNFNDAFPTDWYLIEV